MCSEYLNERYLQGRDFTVQEDPGKVKLHLETDVNIGTIDGWRPPESEATIRDLVETGSLSIGQLFELH